MTLKLRADYHAWWYSEWSGPQTRRYEVQCYVTGNEEGLFIVTTNHQSGLPVEVNTLVARVSIPLFDHAIGGELGLLADQRDPLSFFGFHDLWGSMSARRVDSRSIINAVA